MAMQDYKLEYKGYIIKIKQDFGDKFFIIDGMPCNFGYVVTKDFCNAMPGATWFQTVKQAKKAIDILTECDGDESTFWEKYQTVLLGETK